MSSSTKYDDAFFRTMRKRFSLAEEALQTIHKEALEDWKFRLGDQWDKAIEARRKRDGRSCWTINRIPQFLRQITGEQRKNRPGIEVSAVGDGADVDTALILQGLVRHIERISNAEEAYDTAFEHMVTGGFGWIRLKTDYIEDSADEQEILFERETNPFAHYPDPRCKQADNSDARFHFVITDFDRDDYIEEFGESRLAELSDFSSLADEAPDWIKRDSVRVAEYFWVEKGEREIKRGKATRKKAKRTVRWVLTNGVEILDETFIPGEYIPVVPVYGEEVTVEGERHLIGMVRYARTPQQAYNLWQSAMAEAIALAPKAPYQATPTQIAGYEELYEQSSSSNLPYLLYNPDPKAPGPPSRNNFEPPIQAIAQALQHADNDLHSTTGLYDDQLGAPGQDQSGKAILLRQKQGNNSTYGFQDSLPRALKHLGRIILSWIPTVYDTDRVVRIVNPDGTSKTVPINQPFVDDDGLQKVFDLTNGRYDVAISSGPSYDTMRQEAAESMLQLVQAQPELMQVIGDLVVANFDWPMAKEIAERLKKMLPPALQDNGANSQIPAPVQAKMAQQEQMIEKLTAALHTLSAKAEARQIESASRERIALINARAGIVEAVLKTKSQEAIVAFRSQLEQIDRQLSLIPDPAMDPNGAAGGPNGSPGAPGAPPGGPGNGSPMAQPPVAPGAPLAQPQPVPAHTLLDAA